MKNGEKTQQNTTIHACLSADRLTHVDNVNIAVNITGTTKHNNNQD